MKGILAHGDPCGCAIGNLILGNTAIKLVYDEVCTKWQYPNGEVKLVPYWSDVQCYGKLRGNLNEKGIKELESTGYNLQQTCMIEKAFEVIDYTNDRMFTGLMAVCDTLMKIHEANEEEITQAKRLFVKDPA